MKQNSSDYSSIYKAKKMMLTTRLRNVYQQEQKQRKFVCVMNDVAKTNQDRYDHIIDTEKAEATQRSKKAIEMTRRNIVRQRVLKKCIQNKREEIEKKQASTIYGKHHEAAVSVDEIAGDVEDYMKHNHPRIRRAQKIKDLFEEGLEKGAILDKDTVKHRVKSFFDKPLVELHRIPEVDEVSSKESPCLPSVDKSHFYTGDFGKAQAKGTENSLTVSNVNKLDVSTSQGDNENKALFVRRKVSKYLTEDIPDNFSEASDEVPHPHKGKENVRPTTLPPIKIGTDSEDNPKPAKGTIAELAEKFAKAREKTEMLQRRLIQNKSSKKQVDNYDLHARVDKPSVARRPKSDKTGLKDTKAIMMHKAKGQKATKEANSKIKTDIIPFPDSKEKMDPLSSTLPPIKFKSSSKRPY